MSGADTFKVGDRVFFWTGRGSQGFATIRAIENGRAFLDPEPDAMKGSDYRTRAGNATKPDRWAPRDYGVRLHHLNTPPEPWYKDN